MGSFEEGLYSLPIACNIKFINEMQFISSYKFNHGIVVSIAVKEWPLHSDVLRGDKEHDTLDINIMNPVLFQM